MKRPSQKLPFVAIPLLLAGMLIYGFWPEPIHVEVTKPLQGTLQISVRDDGETRIREKYLVSTPVAGKLQRLSLHPGDTVVANSTILARIEPGEPTLLDVRAIAEAKSRVDAAKAAEQLAGETLKNRIEVRNLARHELERANELKKSNAISPSEFDHAEHQLGVAEADVHSAEFAVKIAAFELAQAEAAFIRSEPNDLPDGDPSVATGSSTFTIPSPVDGHVLRVLHEDSGMIAAGTPLIEIGDPRDLELKVELLSTDAVRVRPGARVFVEHWGGKGVLEGRVRVVEPSAFLKISALGIEEKRVNVIADFTTPANQRESLADGYRVEVRIVVAEIPEATIVPAGALFRDGEQWAVFRIRGQKAEKQIVDVGETNGLETQIISGISTSDQIILYPGDQIQNGVTVQFDEVLPPGTKP